MAKVEIYTRTTCPYCHAAKALLEEKGAEYVEYNIDEDPAKRDEMLARSEGRTTVPEIFINDKLIGGNDNLQELEAEGKLGGLLAE